MPYAFERKKLKIPRELDRRIKMTEEGKIKVKELYNQGVSIREITRRFNISRRVIQFIIFPDRKERARELYKIARLDGRYYNKEKHTKAVREHKRYKQSIKDKLI